MSAIIYRITNNINGKFYIGQTVQCFNDRWAGHCRDARRASKTHFHNAIRKYGPDAFTVELLEETTSDQLNDREQYWIAKLRPEYNLTKGGDGLRGYKHTAETRAKMSAACANRNHTGNNNPFYGKTHSLETREKMKRAAANRGKEWRQKLSKIMLGEANVHRGKSRSLETRTKMIAAKKGHVVSPETRAKISATLKKNAKIK